MDMDIIKQKNPLAVWIPAAAGLLCIVVLTLVGLRIVTSERSRDRAELLRPPGFDILRTLKDEALLSTDFYLFVRPTAGESATELVERIREYYESIHEHFGVGDDGVLEGRGVVAMIGPLRSLLEREAVVISPPARRAGAGLDPNQTIVVVISM